MLIGRDQSESLLDRSDSPADDAVPGRPVSGHFCRYVSVGDEYGEYDRILLDMIKFI